MGDEDIAAGSDSFIDDMPLNDDDVFYLCDFDTEELEDDVFVVSSGLIAK